MRRSNCLILLALLACGCMWAQPLTSIRIGTNPSGPIFYVDGTGYTSPQVFVWPVGSKHIVQYLFSTDVNNAALPYQSAAMDNIRYVFGGWTDNTGLLGPSANPIQTVTADPALTSLTGAVTITYRVRIIFSNLGTTAANSNCAGTPGDAPTDGPRYGIVYFDGACLSDTTEMFIAAGSHHLNAFPYPGWVFYGFLVNTLPPDYLTTINIVGPTNIYPLFSIAKRVNFLSNPPGLKVLVDGAPINTPPANTVAASGSGCAADFTRLPSGAPPGFTPLCYGQFDFLPGSKHRIGAPVPQQDAAGNYWVFSGFSNGMKQNDVYTADTNTGPPDVVTANFIPGVRVSILTNPGGLKLEVDGRTNWPGYSFIWGQGETHHLNAPARQPDSHNRSWKFKSWSNQGTASQDITIPAVTDFAIGATYQVLGQVQVQSVPAGLSFRIDGNPCTTPCVVDRDPGSQMQVSVPASIPNTSNSRYDFGSWLDGASGVSRQITFNQDVQTVTAAFHASYQLATGSDPGNAVTFKFDTASPDGFFADGTQVSVTAVPKNGFKFRRWGGDLSGTYSTGRLLMSAPHTIVAMLDSVPFIAPAGVQNAASPTPDGTVAPGSIISIYGDNLSPSLQVGPTNPLSQTLANVTVTVSDRLLPLFFVSPQQINAQVPSDLPDGDYTIQVHSLGQPDVVGAFTISRDAPGIFTQQNDQNLPLALALHEDGTVVTFDSPARRNETVSIYGTGFGPYDHKVIDGFPIASTDNISVVDPVTVTTGDIDLHPDWTGAAKNMVGMTVVKLKIIDDMPAAANVDLTVLVNGKTSNKVTLPVQ